MWTSSLRPSRLWASGGRRTALASCLLAALLGLAGRPAHGAAPGLAGSYSRADDSTLDIVLLPKSRIRFHLVALWSSRFNRDAPHTGEVSGVVPLRAHRAVYRAEGGLIIMKFSGGHVTVVQKGNIPDFGMNVRADGVYRRTAAGPG